MAVEPETKPTLGNKLSESLESAWNTTKETVSGVKDGISHRLTMEGLLAQAHHSLQDYLNPKLIKAVDRMSKELLRKALGIAFITEAKAGFGLALKGGSGIIILRKPNPKQEDQYLSNEWTAPCAIKTGGISVGFQAGAAKVDHM